MSDTLHDFLHVRRYSPRKVARPGVLAGKLAAGVSDLLASHTTAPVTCQQVIEAQVADLLASKPNAAIELQQLASKSAARAWPLPPDPTVERQRAAGRARAAKMMPERRREIAMLGVEARKQKREAVS